VESLGPLLSSVMVARPARANVCDKRFKSYNTRGVRNPDFIFLVHPIFKMVKAFFPGKAMKWSTAFTRTGRRVIKAQSEKLVDHGVYSNALLHQLYVPRGTGIPDECLLRGMLFEQFAVLLAYVSPVFCRDAQILTRVWAKGRNESVHYFLLAGESVTCTLTVMEWSLTIPVTAPFGPTRPESSSTNLEVLRVCWHGSFEATIKNELSRQHPGLVEPPQLCWFLHRLSFPSDDSYSL
jgi:hypothetical protein